jgi:hypothetical protein
MKRTFSICLAAIGTAAVSVAALAQDKPTAAQAGAPAAVPLTAADFTAGSAFRDSKGVQVGTIVSADASNVVVDTGQTKIAIPAKFFTKDKEGVALTITADQFSAAVAKAHARSEAAKAQAQTGAQASPKQ